jgi:hypothetical protein
MYHFILQSKEVHPAQGCTTTMALLLGLLLQNHHAAGAKTYLLMRLTCNKGLINPKYNGTQQDLTDKKGKTPRICRLMGIQGKSIARIKINFCRKAY